MDWLVSYFKKGESKYTIKTKRFLDHSEDYVDGYIQRMKDTGGEDLVVMKERMD